MQNHLANAVKDFCFGGSSVGKAHRAKADLQTMLGSLPSHQCAVCTALKYTGFVDILLNPTSRPLFYMVTLNLTLLIHFFAEHDLGFIWKMPAKLCKAMSWEGQSTDAVGVPQAMECDAGMQGLGIFKFPYLRFPKHC